MKKFRPFLALLLACWLLALPALADDEVGGDTGEPPPVSDSVEDAGPSSSEEAPPEDPPASEDPPPESEDPPDTSGDPPSLPDDSSDAPENPPPVADDPPGTVDPDPVEPETPVDPLPVYPIPDTSVVTPGLQQTPGAITQVGIEEDSAAKTHQIFTITTIPEFALAALESDAGNTMAQVVRGLFGTYTPRIQTVTTYMDGEPIAVEEQYVPGVAGMDWEWIGGFVVFLLMLYCLFRLLGGSVKYG